VTAYIWRDPARRTPEHTTEAQVTRAIIHPDAVTPRLRHETMAAWQARAVLDVIVQAIRNGREPFAGIRDDAVAAGRAAEREAITGQLLQRAAMGDDLARVVADFVREIM